MAAPWLWAAIVFVLYAIPGNKLRVNSPLFFEGFDKIVHFGMFSTLAFLAQLSAHRIGWFRILACACYSALLEGLQGMLFTERSSDWFDFFANNIGIAVGSLVAMWWFRGQRKVFK